MIFKKSHPQKFSPTKCLKILTCGINPTIWQHWLFYKIIGEIHHSETTNKSSLRNSSLFHLKDQATPPDTWSDHGQVIVIIMIKEYKFIS